jgi:hypothetical protein
MLRLLLSLWFVRSSPNLTFWSVRRSTLVQSISSFPNTGPHNGLVTIVGKPKPRPIRTRKAIAQYWFRVYFYQSVIHEGGITCTKALLGGVNKAILQDRIKGACDICKQCQVLASEFKVGVGGTNVIVSGNSAFSSSSSHGYLMGWWFGECVVEMGTMRQSGRRCWRLRVLTRSGTPRIL